jgi:hypothetical protein
MNLQLSDEQAAAFEKELRNTVENDRGSGFLDSGIS